MEASMNEHSKKIWNNWCIDSTNKKGDVAPNS